jgi:hypothetical protein
MKSQYRRIVRKRLEAAFKVRMRRNNRVIPKMDPPIDGPEETVNLETTAFQARFGDDGSNL